MSDLDKEREQLEAKLKALDEEKKRIEEEAEETKRLEAERLKKLGALTAMEALLKLDTAGIFEVDEDMVIYVGEGDDRTEVEIEEQFEKRGYGWNAYQGSSKGFWYSLCLSRFTGEWKTRKWKKADTAYKKITEILEEYEARKKRNADENAALESCLAELSAKYKNAEIYRYWVRVKSGYSEVLFSAREDGPKIHKVTVSYDHNEAVADLILEKVDD